MLTSIALVPGSDNSASTYMGEPEYLAQLALPKPGHLPKYYNRILIVADTMDDVHKAIAWLPSCYQVLPPVYFDADMDGIYPQPCEVFYTTSMSWINKEPGLLYHTAALIMRGLGDVWQDCRSLT